MRDEKKQWSSLIVKPLKHSAAFFALYLKCTYINYIDHHNYLANQVPIYIVIIQSVTRRPDNKKKNYDKKGENYIVNKKFQKNTSSQGLPKNNISEKIITF